MMDENRTANESLVVATCVHGPGLEPPFDGDGPRREASSLSTGARPAVKDDVGGDPWIGGGGRCRGGRPAPPPPPLVSGGEAVFLPSSLCVCDCACRDADEPAPGGVVRLWSSMLAACAEWLDLDDVREHLPPVSSEVGCPAACVDVCLFRVHGGHTRLLPSAEGAALAPTGSQSWHEGAAGSRMPP